MAKKEIKKRAGIIIGIGIIIAVWLGFSENLPLYSTGNTRGKSNSNIQIIDKSIKTNPNIKTILLNGEEYQYDSSSGIRYFKDGP